MFVTFLLPPMVMVMVMAAFIALVMVNGFYTKFEDIYFFPSILALKMAEISGLFVTP